MVNKEILDSWKEIAKYLGRDTRTCYRWEKELGLPVHRIDNNSPRSKVFAYKSEIDEWLAKRTNCSEISNRSSFLEKKSFIISIFLFLIISSSVFATLYFSIRKKSQSLTSLAVFPINNNVGSLDQEYLSYGIVNGLTNYLSEQNKLKVISAEYPDNFMNTPEYLVNVSKKLRADFLLFGVVENGGDEAKLVFHLIKAKDGTCIWNQEYIDFEVNAFEICNTVCFKIYEKLKLRKDKNSIPLYEARFLEDKEAYDNYLKGNFILSELYDNNNDPWKIFYKGQYYSNQNIRESNEIAIELFTKVIDINPEFVLAYIGLANCYTNFLNFGWQYDLKWLQKAEELLKKANVLSSSLPEYFSTLSKVYLLMASGFNEDTLDEAFEIAEEGIEKYPNNPDINSKISYFYYLKYGETGKETHFNKALTYMENSYLMKPHYIGNIFYADLLMLNKEFNKALSVVEQIGQNSSISVFNFRVATIYYVMGDLNKSKNVFSNRIPNMNSVITNLYLLGKIAAREGEVVQANNYAAQIKALSPDLSRFSTSEFELSSIYFGINKNSLGYSHLIKFFNYPEINKMKFIYHKIIELDKNFDEVRNDFKFRKIVYGGFDG